MKVSIDPRIQHQNINFTIFAAHCFDQTLACGLISDIGNNSIDFGFVVALAYLFGLLESVFVAGCDHECDGKL